MGALGHGVAGVAAGRTTLLGPSHVASDWPDPCPFPYTFQPGMLPGTGTSVSAAGTHLVTAALAKWGPAQ